MKRYNYRLEGGLCDDELRKIDSQATELATRMGIEVLSEKVLKRVAGSKGVNIRGDRVNFSEDRLEDALKNLSYPPGLPFPPYFIGTGAYSMNILDETSGQVRTPTHRDLIEMTQLADALGFGGTSPVKPGDLGSEELAEVAMYKTAYEYSRSINSGPLDYSPKSTVRVADCVWELSRVAGKPFALGCWIISPFRVNSSDLEIILEFLERDVYVYLCTMPVMGVTAPVSIGPAYIQSIAELKVGIALLRVLNPLLKIFTGVFDSIRAYPFDMKYGNFVYGSPDDVFGTLLQLQLNRYYGMPVMAKSLLTASPQPDAQAATEKAIHTVLATLYGARSYTTGGLLSIDEVYSAEQAVIDCEIVNYVKYITEGVKTTDDVDWISVIEEVGPGGTFLEHETTLSGFREAFWTGELFECKSFQTRFSQGLKSLLSRAGEVAREKIARHDYRIEKEKAKELEKIYGHAEKKLRS